MAKLNSSYKRWSLDCHDVSVEMLEDMGVSLLEDDSCSNASSKLETVSKHPPTVGIKRKEPPSPVVQSTTEDDDESYDSFLLSKRKRIEGPPGLDGFSRLSDEM